MNATALAYANGTATAIANANATATANANATATANANATATANANATATARANATATANAIATTIAGSNATATAIAALPFVSNWTFCANENGTCNFSGTKEVRYGENGFYFYAIFTNTTACSNGVFGDPVSGTAKHCYYRSVNSIQSVTAIRRAGDRNKLDISIKLARTGSNVTITDSQSGQVLSNQACATSGAVTCTYTITLTDAQIAAGMITVSGTDFNGQTFSVGYPAK